MLDSADQREVEEWTAKGVIAGGTTNPVLLKQAFGTGRPDQAVVERLAKAHFPFPFCVQVTTRVSAAAMVAEGLELASWAENIVVKVPVVDPDGRDLLEVIHHLAQADITVNATACLTAPQAWLAAQAGARYTSILWGRARDEGGDPVRTVALLDEWLPGDGPEVIIGSIRSVGDAYDAMSSSADYVTVPGPILERMARHAMAATTSAQFFAASS